MASGVKRKQPQVLIIARHFPPVISAGARRPYLLALGFRELGWDVRVAAPQLTDEFSGFVVEHPLPGVRDGEDTFRRISLKDRFRQHVMLPDPDVRWALKLVREIRSKRDFAPDVVLTSSPPESTHVAGALLQHLLRCCWVADFRDYWIAHPLRVERTNPLRAFAERTLARHLLRRADLVVGVEEGMLAEIGELGVRTPLLLVPQASPAGWQRPASDQYIAASSVPTFYHSGSFSLSHAARTIEPVLTLADELEKAGQSYRIILRGILSASEQNACSENVKIELRPPTSLQTVWKEQAEADILLLVAAEGAPMPPGKLAEYRAARRPILCFGGGDWVEREKLFRSVDSALAAVRSPADPNSILAPSDVAQLISDRLNLGSGS